MHRHHSDSPHGPHGRSRGGRGLGKLFGRFGHARHERHKGKLLTSEELQLIALQMISEKPHYGYEIIKAIEEHSSGIYSPSPGMIYPVLTYLEEIGYAVPKMDGAKKLFQITDEGSAYIKQQREVLLTILDQLKAYGQKMAYFQEQIAQEEATDDRWGGGHRHHGADAHEWRELKMEFHQLRHELKAALFEKISAPLEEKKRVLDVLRNAIAVIREG